MDARRFDSLTLALGSALGRRRFLAMAAGLVAGATATVDVAEAATTCRRGRQTCQRNTQCCSGTCQTGKAFALRDRNRCTCEEGLALCNNACVDTDTDMRNCGACGNACRAGDHCVEGQCLIHQQCYTDGTGFCYMTPDGLEHRADGVYFGENQPNFAACTRQADCTGIYAECTVPGVTCTCVRAFDNGDGYQDVPYVTGRCVSILDSGDRAYTCDATSGDVCAFTTAREEQRLCQGSFSELDRCIDFACEGVGPCDDDDVSCSCVLGVKTTYLPFYTNFLGLPAVCVAYSATDGSCPA